MKQAKDLVDVLKEANQTINPKLMDLVEMAKSFGGSRGRKWFGRSSGRGFGRYDNNKRGFDRRNHSAGRYDNNRGNKFEEANNSKFGNTGFKGKSIHKIFM